MYTAAINVIFSMKATVNKIYKNKISTFRETCNKKCGMF